MMEAPSTESVLIAFDSTWISSMTFAGKLLMRYWTIYLVKSGLSVFHVRSISQSGVRQKGNEDVELSSMFSDENFLPTKRSMFILSLDMDTWNTND